VIKNLTKCVGEVGCDVVGQVFSGLAASEAVLSETEKELGVVLVDIGGGTMSVAIYVEGALSYSSVLQVGAINVTKDLAAGLRISLESAEKIKILLGASKSKDKEDDIDISSLHLSEEIKSVSLKTLVEGIIRPRLNEMFQIIGSEIKKSGFAGLTPSGLVLCGGGSLTVSIVESAKRMLAMPVRVGSPLGISGLIDDINNPAFAASVGLLRFAQNAAQSDNPAHNSSPSLPNLSKFPLKGVLGKVTQFIKSLLP
jgi:cell division protein FtsA